MIVPVDAPSLVGGIKGDCVTEFSGATEEWYASAGKEPGAWEADAGATAAGDVTIDVTIGAMVVVSFFSSDAAALDLPDGMLLAPIGALVAAFGALVAAAGALVVATRAKVTGAATGGVVATRPKVTGATTGGGVAIAGSMLSVVKGLSAK